MFKDSCPPRLLLETVQHEARAGCSSCNHPRRYQCCGIQSQVRLLFRAPDDPAHSRDDLKISRWRLSANESSSSSPKVVARLALRVREHHFAGIAQTTIPMISRVHGREDEPLGSLRQGLEQRGTRRVSRRLKMRRELVVGCDSCS